METVKLHLVDEKIGAWDTASQRFLINLSYTQIRIGNLHNSIVVIFYISIFIFFTYI